jgi:hypothetical protein
MWFGALFRGNTLVYAANRVLSPVKYRIELEILLFYRYRLFLAVFLTIPHYSSRKGFFNESALFSLCPGIPKR